jgi:hypothetical protein
MAQCKLQCSFNLCENPNDFSGELEVGSSLFVNCHCHAQENKFFDALHRAELKNSVIYLRCLEREFMNLKNMSDNSCIVLHCVGFIYG